LASVLFQQHTENQRVFLLGDFAGARMQPMLQP
jgi:hypothetical protein